MSLISGENIDISYSSDYDISSNAEELQMLEKLRINENAVINNEKEMQKKIFQYEQKIRELQKELNSQGSTTNLNRNNADYQFDIKSSNSFASQSSKSENLEFINNSFNELNTKQALCQKNIFTGNEANSYNHNILTAKNNVNNYYGINNQTNICQAYNANYNDKYNNRLHLINDLEQFVNTKFTEAERIMNTLLYPEFRSSSTPCQPNSDACDLQEQNIKLKSQLKELKTSLSRYLNRHEAAKRKREARENLLNQKIAFLEEREKSLAQIIEMQKS